MRRFLRFLTFSYGTVFWNQPLQGIFFEARKWHYNWSPGLMTYALCSISRARPVSRALPAPRGRPGSLFGTFPFVFCLTQKNETQNNNVLLKAPKRQCPRVFGVRWPGPGWHRAAVLLSAMVTWRAGPSLAVLRVGVPGSPKDPKIGQHKFKTNQTQ